MTELLETVASIPPKTLKETITRLVHNMANALGYGDEDDDMNYDDDVDDIANTKTDGVGVDNFQATHTTYQIAALKNDFLEVVAADWRPGVIRMGVNDFGWFFALSFNLKLTLYVVVCVSSPVVKVR